MAVAAASFASQAYAGTISLVASPSTITTAGEVVGVDIVVNGLPSAAGGFTLNLDYANLALTSFVLGPGTPGPFGSIPFDLGSVDLGGSVFLSAFFDLSEPDASNGFDAQKNGGSFTLAHVDFTGVAPGDFTLGLRNVAISNWEGDFDDPAFNLLVCSGAACSVPEPATPLLVAAALGALSLRRKHKAA
jgi:hypothetical protein